MLVFLVLVLLSKMLYKSSCIFPGNVLVFVLRVAVLALFSGGIVLLTLLI